MDDHVHVGHGPGLGDVFLAVELERCWLFRLGLVSFHGDFELYEEAPGAAAGIVDGHAGLRLEHTGHDGADLGRGVELAGALAAAFGELADEIFVALADDVGFDVIEPQALGADSLNEIRKAVVVEVPLAVGGGVEIHAVDDALEQWIFTRDGPHVGGDGFADLVRQLADDRPDWILDIFRPQWQKKPHQFVIRTHKFEGVPTRADLCGDAIQLVIEHVAEAFGEDEGEDIVFVLRRVLGPAN